MLSAARSLIFPSFLKKSTKSTKAHLQSQEYSFWLFLARLSDLYCGNVSKKRFLTSLNVKKFFFISKSFLFVAYTIAIPVPNLRKPTPFSNHFIGRVRICVSLFVQCVVNVAPLVLCQSTQQLLCVLPARLVIFIQIIHHI